jgi:hypothetical protein
MEAFVPAELEAGVCADHLGGWWAAHQVVLDFSTARDEEELLVAARVRVPATAALDLLRSFEEVVRGYELEYGEIHRPRPRGAE